MSLAFATMPQRSLSQHNEDTVRAVPWSVRTIALAIGKHQKPLDRLEPTHWEEVRRLLGRFAALESLHVYCGRALSSEEFDNLADNIRCEVTNNVHLTLKHDHAVEDGRKLAPELFKEDTAW